MAEDDSAAARKGSRLQLQISVNRRTAELDAAIADAIPELEGAQAAIEWLSPLAADGFAEYRDAAFLERVGLPGLAGELAAFWPHRGPTWDGLARVDLGEGGGILLVEAKAHPGEIRGSGTKATPDSRARIAEAMAWTQGALGEPLDPEAWLGPYYQLANRLAHTAYLRALDVPAWLALVTFTGDEEHIAADEDEMYAAVEDAFDALGILGTDLPYVGLVSLPARGRDELAASS
jgi:hypothetical protein